MHHFFVTPEQVKENQIWIEGSDVNHIKNVLRMKPGEEIAVSNGTDGKEYRCGITAIEEDRVICATSSAVASMNSIAGFIAKM